MKEVNFSFDFYDDGLYNVSDIIENLGDSLGLTFEDLLSLLLEEKITSWNEIKLKLRQKNWNFDVKVALKNYQYLNKLISILRTKGLNYLALLKYLGMMDDREMDSQLEYEIQLESCNLFHYRSILTGRDLKALLVGLGHTVKNLQEGIEKINNLETYDYPLIDSFSLQYGYSKIYPSETIVAQEDKWHDKTSISPRNGRSRKKISNF